MNQTNVVAFSMNRAMQLDAFLRSMRRFAPHYYRSVKIMAKYDAGDHRRSLDILRARHPGCLWMEHSPGLDDFQALLLQAIAPKVPRTTMLVDDDLFFRMLPEFELPPGTAYAPRLGYNCTYSYNGGGGAQRVPTRLWRDPGGEGDLDFDCTMSVDGHVYHTDYLLPFLESVHYSTPNQLEENLCQTVRPRLAFAEHSCLVGVPNNVVQTGYPNRHMGGSPDDLCRLFLDGFRIALDRMTFDVRSVHEPLSYVFEKEN